MASYRGEVLKEIERQKRAYYEHLEKARTYPHRQDKEFALKTAARIRHLIEDLAASIEVTVDLEDPNA